MSDSWNEARVGRLEERVSEIREIMATNTAILKVNTAHLEEHIRRTALLEKQVAGIATEARIVRWAIAVAGLILTVLEIVKLSP